MILNNNIFRILLIHNLKQHVILSFPSLLLPRMNLLHRMKTLHIVYIILRKISLQCNLRYKIYTFTLQRFVILLKNSITESLNV